MKYEYIFYFPCHAGSIALDREIHVIIIYRAGGREFRLLSFNTAIFICLL